MKITFEQEKKLLKAMYMSVGMTESDADILATVPTQSDFTGMESHGMSRAVLYVMGLRGGSMNAHAEFKVLSETESLAAMDGDDSVGIISMVKGYELLAEKAKKTGIAFGTGKGSSNIGCGNYYGWRAAKDNLIILACANTSPLQAPFGGADPLIGSNPIICSFPSNSFPVTLDIATTLVALGKIQNAQRNKTAIPDTWCLDKDGKPTTDPSKYYTNTPMATYKGYGLAVMVDMFAAVLSGAAYGTDIGIALKMQKERSGWAILLIDPTKFMPLEDFKARVDDYIRMMKESRKAEGVEEIFLPGELEFNEYHKRMNEGFEVEKSLEIMAKSVAIQCKLGTKDMTLQQIIDALE